MTTASVRRYASLEFSVGIERFSYWAYTAAVTRASSSGGMHRRDVRNGASPPSDRLCAYPSSATRQTDRSLILVTCTVGCTTRCIRERHAQACALSREKRERWK